MPVDKFGRSSKGRRQRTLEQVYENTITQSSSGDYNVKNHKLINIQTPTLDSDCATKGYVDSSMNVLNILYNKSQQDTSQIQHAINELRKSVMKNTNHYVDLDSSTKTKFQTFRTNIQSIADNFKTTTQKNHEYLLTTEEHLRKLKTVVTSMKSEFRTTVDKLQNDLKRNNDSAEEQIKKLKTTVKSLTDRVDAFDHNFKLLNDSVKTGFNNTDRKIVEILKNQSTTTTAK